MEKNENQEIKDTIKHLRKKKDTLIKIKNLDISLKEKENGERYFLNNIKKSFTKYFGFLTNNGLPYSFGASLWCALSNNTLEEYTKEELDNFDQIYNLFNLLNKENKLDNIIKKAETYLSNIKKFCDEEWSFEIVNLENNEKIVRISNLFDKNFYLETNIFSSLDFKKYRYFKFFLECVIKDDLGIYELKDLKKFEILYSPFI